MKNLHLLRERVDGFVAEANVRGLEISAEIEDDVIRYHFPGLTRLRPRIVRLAHKYGLTIPNIEKGYIGKVKV